MKRIALPILIVLLAFGFDGALVFAAGKISVPVKSARVSLLAKTKSVPAPKKKVIVVKKPVPKPAVKKPAAKKASTAAQPVIGKITPADVNVGGALISKIKTEPGYLTISGVLYATNDARQKNGSLPPLTESAILDEAAAARLKDMFDNQYFAHVSPSGVAPSDVASRFGYQFISFGENIALGKYDGDNSLVDAWMNSPHHRENILGTKYKEIGIAVGKGMYKGAETWIAVQNFARSSSDCALPSTTLKAQIDANTVKLAELQASADQTRSSLMAMKPQTQEEIDRYNLKVYDYNNLVDQLTALTAQTKDFVSAFNQEVSLYNSCVRL